MKKHNVTQKIALEILLHKDLKRLDKSDRRFQDHRRRNSKGGYA